MTDSELDDDQQAALRVKSVNQLWRESGKTVPFKDFADNYNRKVKLNASGSTDLFSNMFSQPAISSTSGLASAEAAVITPPNTNNNVLPTGQLFGIPVFVLWSAGIIIVIGIAYVIIKKRHNDAAK